MKKILVKDKFLNLRHFFIPIDLLNLTKSNDYYVSEMNITDEDLILVYKKNKLTKEVVIKLSDIESINAMLKANYVEKYQRLILSCETIVTIKTYSQGTITFSDIPIAPMSYDFMLRLLRVSSSLPNFTYCVIGNSDIAKEDVIHFARYGKRLPLLKKLQLDTKIYPVWKMYLIVIFLFLFIGIILCFRIPDYITRHNEYKNYEYKYQIEQNKKLYDRYLHDKYLHEHSK